MRKHPLQEFVKYMGILVLLILTINIPTILCILIISTVMTKGKLWLVDLWIFTSIVFIDLFSSIDGVTFLAYHNYHIITYEALVYGVVTGLRMICIIQICWKFSQDVRSDKLVIVTSQLAPPLSIMISMSVRNIKRYSEKLTEIYWTQFSMEELQTIIVKIIVAIRSLSVLIDWALDNGMESALSMERRFYGSPNRTYYNPVKLLLRDKVEIVIYLIVVLAIIVTDPKTQIIPEIVFKYSILNTFLIVFISLYCLVEEIIGSSYRRSNLQ